MDDRILDRRQFTLRSTHPHTVDLTTAEVMSIASGQRVSKASSNEDAHTHTVTFN